jgi:hypothetical protein
MMMRVSIVAAASMTCLLASSADATLITKSYSVVAIFTSGPFPTVTADYTVTFDPTATVSNAALDSLLITGGGASFAVPAGFFTFASSSLGIGGLINGTNSASSGTNDFLISFSISPEGDVTSRAGSASYSTADSRSLFNASSVTARDVTATVPEPASWAMFIGGFGLIGGMMRRRYHPSAHSA